MHRLLFIFKILFASSILIAAAQPDDVRLRYAPLFARFDAGELTRQEKAFLQLGLVLTGLLNEVATGEWKTSSDAALSKFAGKRFGRQHMADPSFFVATRLYEETLAKVHGDGWKSAWFNSTGYTYPSKYCGSINQKFRATTLSCFRGALLIRSYDMSYGEHSALHAKLLRQSEGQPEPAYTVRNASSWVSAATLQGEERRYIRSQLVGGRWLAVEVQAQDAGLSYVAGVSATIQFGTRQAILQGSRGVLRYFSGLAHKWLRSAQVKDFGAELAAYKYCRACRAN
ncbi:hypothetical protein [Polycladidibacter hongkongensis]|uniref:hypothetical protein n=1 Tax=Polycladidibacter hongkongensis TaxID=1647556 RepID=UPI00082DE13D|nr:hypothetical protein [Pseudovibrio hongkongensis]